MWLEMHLKQMFIDRVYLDYDGFETVNDRQQYQERIAEEMYFKHMRAIKQVMEDPEFYIKEESKMNAPDFGSGSWEEIIMQHGSDEAKAAVDLLAATLRDPEQLQREQKLNDMGIKIGEHYFKDEMIPNRNYTPQQEAFRSTIIKPKKKYVYPKKPAVPVREPISEKLERHKGGYSNTQWNDIDENDLGKQKS